MTTLAKTSRRIGVRVLSGLIVFVATLVALIAGVLAPYYLSVYVAQIVPLVLTGVVSFAAVAWVGMRLSALLWRSNRPGRFASISSGVLTGAS